MDAYQRYGRALLRKAERIVRNRSTAQDLVQDLFVDLHAKGETPDLPYLYRAITNRCLTFIRDEKNRARLLEGATDLDPPRSRAEDRVVGMDLLLKLTRSLDARALEILFYRYFDDMTQEEIATMVGLSRKTVGKTLDEIHGVVRELS